jgi:hypothetical protein
MEPNAVQCVIAWTEEAAEWTGERWAPDLGERCPLRLVKAPRAAMWLNEATPSDVEKARRHAAERGYRVFTFTGEKDPLGAARRAVLTETEKT